MPSLTPSRAPRNPAHQPRIFPADHVYPVVGSFPLEPARRRWTGRRRRHLHELPDQPPGSTLVFFTDGRYALSPVGTDMLSADVVVRAVRVEVVSIKRELVAVTKEYTSPDADRSLLLTVIFACRVVDPVLLLDAGVWDAQPGLYEYLADDDIVAAFGTRSDVATDPDVALRIITRHLARRGLEEPDLPGMQARLVDARVGIARTNGATPEIDVERADPDGASGPRDDYGDDDFAGPRSADGGPADGFGDSGFGNDGFGNDGWDE